MVIFRYVCIVNFCLERLSYIFTDPSHDKTSRDAAVLELRQQTVEALSDNYEPKVLDYAFSVLVKYAMRRMARDSWLRVDGRSVDEVRPIFMETDLYPKLHGSAMFQRGQSQVSFT